jgi:glycosyltransferase involved in cell wall biosynthesis
MPQPKKKITIITPCFNAERFIRETIESVLDQTAVRSGRVVLEYIICDGKSSDKTVSVIEEIGDGSIRLISEPDRGMYDALAKGLRAASGDIVAYLNAGDFYNRHAFDTVLDLFETNKVTWLTGFNIHYNDKSQVVYAMLPYRYRRELFACGMYGPVLPYVQQESTFWSTELVSQLDLEFLSSLKFAGDFYLWLQFSKTADLITAAAYLGGFRRHKGQLSHNLNLYHEEMRRLTRKPRFWDYVKSAIDKLIWYFTPQTVKKALNPSGILVYDHKLQGWK